MSKREINYVRFDYNSLGAFSLQSFTIKLQYKTQPAKYVIINKKKEDESIRTFWIEKPCLNFMNSFYELSIRGEQNHTAEDEEVLFCIVDKNTNTLDENQNL